ncbi:hypothetical protein NEHOM01_0152 [Nematocida homosporus]|uniref:uncharacterized protein n=1 Tax=Nematocida homosporus TaxID=1912981 RepID=UPI002220C4A4|nr:uncharacterized protein NEHOM01_0152 [Nematocida homosporus]KAI5184407.1 hypothetical protein NEHOM01_0152 [Nematocida homosporus]
MRSYLSIWIGLLLILSAVDCAGTKDRADSVCASQMSIKAICAAELEKFSAEELLTTLRASKVTSQHFAFGTPTRKGKKLALRCLERPKQIIDRFLAMSQPDDEGEGALDSVEGLDEDFHCNYQRLMEMIMAHQELAKDIETSFMRHYKASYGKEMSEGLKEYFQTRTDVLFNHLDRQIGVLELVSDKVVIRSSTMAALLLDLLVDMKNSMPPEIYEQSKGPYTDLMKRIMEQLIVYMLKENAGLNVLLRKIASVEDLPIDISEPHANIQYFIKDIQNIQARYRANLALEQALGITDEDDPNLLIVDEYNAIPVTPSPVVSEFKNSILSMLDDSALLIFQSRLRDLIKTKVNLLGTVKKDQLGQIYMTRPYFKAIYTLIEELFVLKYKNMYYGLLVKLRPKIAMADRPVIPPFFEERALLLGKEIIKWNLCTHDHKSVVGALGINEANMVRLLHQSLDKIVLSYSYLARRLEFQKKTRNFFWQFLKALKEPNISTLMDLQTVEKGLDLSNAEMKKLLSHCQTLYKGEARRLFKAILNRTNRLSQYINRQKGPATRTRSFLAKLGTYVRKLFVINPLYLPLPYQQELRDAISILESNGSNALITRLDAESLSLKEKLTRYRLVLTELLPIYHKIDMLLTFLVDENDQANYRAYQEMLRQELIALDLESMKKLPFKQYLSSLVQSKKHFTSSKATQEYLSEIKQAIEETRKAISCAKQDKKAAKVNAQPDDILDKQDIKKKL